MPLTFSFRIRDLLHGYISLTKIEEKIINHPLFQRLRHIRQNDVAFYVYPSMNISRFEHSIGTAFVAGKMAMSVIQSKMWTEYQSALKKSGFDLNPEQFQQCVRIYALLHDIGHLPLSHLFEQAFEDFAKLKSPDMPLEQLYYKLTGVEGFEKLHEAIGVKLARLILDEIKSNCEEEKLVKQIVLRLMALKKMSGQDSILWPIKELIDSEIDADRVDSTARDGLLAGGEYGNYDIERICSTVFIHQRDNKWRLAYGHKSIGTIEALLFERYRTHVWIHFHHRVSALKAAVRLIVSKLLITEEISLKDIIEKSDFYLYDDVWLWNLIRNWNPSDNDITVMAAKNCLILRDKSLVNLLWKNRKDFREMHKKLEEKSELRDTQKMQFVEKLNRSYEQELSKQFNDFPMEARVLHHGFKPIGKIKVVLIDEDGNYVGDIVQLSALCKTLQQLWDQEIRYHIILFGKSEDRNKIKKKWLECTSKWIKDDGPFNS